MGYITGKIIKELREKQQLTQKELADRINVSDKTISKWETEKGLPDISVIEDLAKALGTSITELLTGDLRKNENISGNMRKMHFYVCPICGNIITSVGQGVFSCCGITLYEEEAEKCN
ncbi:MAG: helix-turn-helix domain-containing protein [Lachnospirales bacterium]